MFAAVDGDTVAAVVYAIIYHFTTTAGGCRSSYTALADRLKIGRATVYRKITQLIEKGLVNRAENGALTAPKETARRIQIEYADGGTVVKLNTHRIQNEYAPVFKMNTPSRNINGISRNIYIHQNADLCAETETGKKPQKEGSEREETDERKNEAFKAFWAEYPRKVGKADARRAFEEAATDEDRIREILDGLKRQKEQDFNFREMRFIPHPATWLSREGWEDEPTPPKPNGRRAYVPQYIYTQERGEYDETPVSEEELQEIKKHVQDE